MSQKKKAPEVTCRLIKSQVRPVKKADVSTQVADQELSIWLEPKFAQKGLKAMVSQSSILPQCIQAYSNNIAGTGMDVRYREDLEENEEMEQEYDRALSVLELLSMDKDTKEVFEDIIQARETYGIAYLEVIRNLMGEVVTIAFIRDTPTVRKTIALEPYVETETFYKGQIIKRKRKYCKYRQQVNGKTVYFKEIGDPRVMNRHTGEYEEGGGLSVDDEANEILEFAIGSEPYGEVRWVGQTLGVDGSHKAESLNNRYFEEGRHTPMMIMVRGGTLSDDSFSKLQEYMDGIKGEAGQHAFMILETESTTTHTALEGEAIPEIEIKDMAAMLQKDELFQEYLNNSRRKIQSAFRLPDLYVGYTTDFNRATAQTAQEVTEKQVFAPQRRSLAWVVNHILLSSYNFRFVEVYFKEPDMSNLEDMAKILAVTAPAGGLTPNKAKQLVYEMMGENAENYQGEWGEIPLAYSKSQGMGANAGILNQMESQIRKAYLEQDESVVAVMKEVRDMLIKKEKES